MNACWALVLVGVVGCTPDPTPSDPDAPSTSAILHVGFTAAPLPPATISNEQSIATLTLQLANLRIVGDAAPGDPRTYLDHVTLAWSAGHVPLSIAFDTAPPGRYSQVEFELDGTSSIEITGMASIEDGPLEPYRFRDANRIAVMLPIDVEHDERNDTTLTITFELEKVVSAIDLQDLPIVAGERLLDTGDPQIAEFESKLKTAFK